jgi:hypothetical protein
MPVSENISLLPELDAEFLQEKGFDCEIVQGAGEIRVIIHSFPFPEQYTPRASNLMIRLPAGYPNANPDMFWTNPDVKLSNGAYPLTADYHDSSAGGWQRWSRHDNSWRGGVDNLRTKFASVRRELEKGR